MKKSISLFFCLAMLLSVMTGCGSSSRNEVKPNDNEMDRPGVNNNVVNDGEGMIGQSGTAKPNTTDNSLPNQIENGVNRGGEIAREELDKAGDAVNDAVDKMTRG
jgi:hypothetical protein